MPNRKLRVREGARHQSWSGLVPARRRAVTVAAASCAMLAASLARAQSGPARAESEPARAESEPASEGNEPVFVEVRGTPRGAATSSLSSAQAREVPGAFGDPVRAIETLPGVVPTVSGLPVFFIRGAPPASVGYYIDGVEVPLLYHAFLGPSVLHPGSLAGVTLEPGAAPVEFGRSAGSVVTAQSSSPRTEFGGEANLRVFDAGALVESPFAGGAGSALVSGRYSFTGLLVSTFTNEDFGYWDYQLRLSRRLSPRDEVGVSAFGARDHYGGESLSTNVGGDTGFHRIDLRYQRALRSGTLTAGLTLGRDETSDDSASLTDHSVRGRVQGVLGAGPATVKFGADARIDVVRLEASEMRSDRLDLLALFPSRTDEAAGMYAAVRVQPERRIAFEPGVRLDLYASQGEVRVALDPRLLVTAELSRNIAVEHRFGISSQRPNFVPGVPAAQVGTLEGGLTRGVHASSAVRARLPAEFSLYVAGFQSEYQGVIDPLGKARDFKLDRGVLDERQTIRARGVELRFGRPLTRHVGGYVSYTLSWATQNEEREESPSGYDRRHVIQGALAAELFWSLRAGVRALYYTGFPALLLLPDGTTLSDSRRSPGYVRVDTRLERRFVLNPDVSLSVVAEVLNATNAKEPLRYECGERCELTTAGPILLPSLGVEATF